MASPLKKGSRNENKKFLVYTLQFINPYDVSFKDKEEKMIVIRKARAKLLRVFKTLETEANQNVIPQKAQDQLWWLKWDLPPNDIKKKKISMKMFFIGILSTVLHTIKNELGIHYELLFSRDKDELFCKLYVTESWLIKRAYESDYLLRFKHKEEKWTHSFQKFSPCGPFSLQGKYLNTKKILFSQYDSKNSLVKTGGSYFTFNDKVRLINDAIYYKMDLYVLKNYGIMIDAFPIHDNPSLDYLKSEWATMKAFFISQPLTEIKNYYSEQIAFYFAWMGVYATFMGICSVVGFVVFIVLIISSYLKNEGVYTAAQVFFCLFLAIWASLFDQFWTRRERELAWQWGTAKMTFKEHQREKFEGKFQKDEVTGKMKVLMRESEKRNIKKTMSFVVIAFLIIVVIAMVIAIFRLRVLMKSTDDLKDYGSIVPALVYAIQISIFDLIYSKVSVWLNNLENHETMNIYNNSLAFKLFLFRFINSYCGLFYIAFIKMYQSSDQCTENGCMYDLGFQLSVIFITNMVLNIIELGLPWFLYKFRVRWEERRIKKLNDMNANIRKELYQVETESKYEPYENPIEDYMEMALQFGFVALFGSSFPILPILAFIEILIEIRVDSWKLCNITRRPEPVQSESIGIWKNIIVFIAYFGAITNSGIVVFTSGALNNFDNSTKVLIFIIIEHLFVIGIAAVSYLTPDSSKVVRKGISWCERVTHNKTLGKLIDDSIKLEKRESLDATFRFYLNKGDIRYHEE